VTYKIPTQIRLSNYKFFLLVMCVF